MRLMYHFIMTPLTFMYLTRKGTSDIMRSEQAILYPIASRVTNLLLTIFWSHASQRRRGGGRGGGEEEGGSRVIDDRAQLPGSISANPGLSCFNSDFFFFCSKAFARIIFAIPLENLIIKLYTKRIQPNFKFKFCSIPGFSLDLTLNNPALVESPRLLLLLLFKSHLTSFVKHLHIRLY